MLSIANKKALVVAISGGSGSGKTTIAHRLRQYMPEGVKSVVIYQDNYYKDQKDVPLQKRFNNNYDTPSAFDWALMKHDLEALKNKRPIDSPVYDFTNHTRSAEKEHIEPVDVIIFEGFMALHANIVSLSDIRLFVDTPSDERLLRRMMRDIKERNRTFESIANQWRFTVRPMYRAHVAPQKEVAHIIIPWYEISSVAIKAIKGAIVDFINAPDDGIAKSFLPLDSIKAAEEEIQASVESYVRSGTEVVLPIKKVEMITDSHGNAVPGTQRSRQPRQDMAARMAQSMAAKQRNLEKRRALEAAGQAGTSVQQHQTQSKPVEKTLSPINQPVAGRLARPLQSNRLNTPGPQPQKTIDAQQRPTVSQQFKGQPRNKPNFARPQKPLREDKSKPVQQSVDKTDKSNEPEPDFGF